MDHLKNGKSTLRGVSSLGGPAKHVGTDGVPLPFRERKNEKNKRRQRRMRNTSGG